MVGKERQASLRGHSKTGRHRQPGIRHLGQAGALAAQQGPAYLLPGEQVDPLLCHGHLPPALPHAHRHLIGGIIGRGLLSCKFALHGRRTEKV